MYGTSYILALTSYILLTSIPLYLHKKVKGDRWLRADKLVDRSRWKDIQQNAYNRTKLTAMLVSINCSWGREWGGSSGTLFNESVQLNKVDCHVGFNELFILWFLGSRVRGKQWDTIQRIRANKADCCVVFDDLFILWFLGSRVRGKQWDTFQRIRANKVEYHVGFDDLFILWVPGVAGEREAVGHYSTNPCK